MAGLRVGRASPHDVDRDATRRNARGRGRRTGSRRQTREAERRAGSLRRRLPASRWRRPRQRAFVARTLAGCRPVSGLAMRTVHLPVAGARSTGGSGVEDGPRRAYRCGGSRGFRADIARHRVPVSPAAGKPRRTPAGRDCTPGDPALANGLAEGPHARAPAAILLPLRRPKPPRNHHPPRGCAPCPRSSTSARSDAR
jgi:hypothetical protein